MTSASAKRDPVTVPALLPSVKELHAQHANFVWKSLQRCGVARQDLKDMTQEVFVQVIRRLHTFDGTSQITTWLFGIALRVASNYRRLSRRRHEHAVDDIAQHADGQAPREGAAVRLDPEQSHARTEARAQLERMLDRMDPDKRAVFVMFEIEGMSGQQIADIMGVALGTVHSRLHSARRVFAEMVEAVGRKDAVR